MDKHKEQLDKKIEEFDRKAFSIIWTIFISMVTAVIVVILATGSINL